MTDDDTLLSPEKKIAGILVPLSAIRGNNDAGIGDTESLVEMAKWASKKGFRLIQILPVNETCSDHSPYNILSSVAWEPSTLSVSPSWFPDITKAEHSHACAKHEIDRLREGPVKHAAVRALKHDVLKNGFARFKSKKTARHRDFDIFCSRESEWLADYAIFRALVSWNDDDEVVCNWPEEHRSPASAREWIESLSGSAKESFSGLVEFHNYVQWNAFAQWHKVREEFDRLGMALMGDIPVGVSIYSADVWAEPGIFDTGRSCGAPPEKVFKSDPFTEKWGQNWGFPLYNWQAMSRHNFAWWRRRLQVARSVFHLLRVDHALGFFRIYSFPWRPEDNARFTDLSPEQAMEITGGQLPGFIPRNDDSPENRDYNRMHGEMLFRVMLEETGAHRLIAEDLGEVAPYVRPVLEALEIPGFKIPQWEHDISGNISPGPSYPRLSLATFATHDHPPVRDYWESLASKAESPETKTSAISEMRSLMEFCGGADFFIPCEFTAEVHKAFIKGLFDTNSWLAVHQITDIFALRDRFNVPGAIGDANWTTRIPGSVGEWDRIFKNQIHMVSQAIRSSGRKS